MQVMKDSRFTEDLRLEDSRCARGFDSILLAREDAKDLLRLLNNEPEKFQHIMRDIAERMI